MQINLTINPARGKQEKKTLDAKDGETLGQMLERHGVGTDGYNVFLNDEPAKLDQPVSANVRLDSVNVTVSERPRGS